MKSVSHEGYIRTGFSQSFGCTRIIPFELQYLLYIANMYGKQTDSAC